MKANINGTDKIMRIVLFLIVLALYLTGVLKGILGIILLMIGIVLLITAFLNFCPLYYFLGMNTKKSK